MNNPPLGSELENVMRLRREGLISEALGQISRVLQHCPPDGPVLVELIKLLLLSQQNDAAYNAYLALRRLPDTHLFWEAEYLARLEISHQREIPELRLPRLRRSSQWVTVYRAERVDPLYDVSIVGCSVFFGVDQSGKYLFFCNCPSCNSRYPVAVYTSFLIYREFLCPVCLARQLIRYETIKQFVENRLSFLVSEQVYALDYGMKGIEMELEDDALSDGDLPPLCKMLYTDGSIMAVRSVLNQMLGSKGQGR